MKRKLLLFTFLISTHLGATSLSELIESGLNNNSLKNPDYNGLCGQPDYMVKSSSSLARGSSLNDLKQENQ